VLTETIADAHTGAVIAGPAGVGKSRLAAALVDRARAQGRPAAWAVATRSAATIPFGALASLLASSSDQLTVGRADLLARAAAATDVGHLLERALGGPVEGRTRHLLWKATDGNPLFLYELVLAGHESGRLCFEDGVWQWRGQLEVSERLAELVDTRVGRLS